MMMRRRATDLLLWTGLCGLQAAACCAVAADWPMWRGDAARGAVTSGSLPADLELHWQLQLPAPRPAWPAEQGKVRFDASYEPVAAGPLLFVPSMVDGSVTAYRLADAQFAWRFYTDGPVRFAPVVYQDRVLFASDDGHLYCVTAGAGTLVWKRRGGPDDRKVLGNDRLISMWPARGAPVVWEDTVYWAAGIWPFMGVYVEAVDIASGQPVWTNSGSGSNYTVQQHNSPAFAGIAPQGYLTVNDTTLLVSGGLTVPAAFDRQTGRFLYYRPGVRELGKDIGSFDVLLGPDWFANRGRVQRLQDGEPLVAAPVDIVTPHGTYGIAGKQLVASQLQVVEHVATTVDRKGKAKHATTWKLPELWRTQLPDGITALHVKTANCFVASDDGQRVVLLNVPQSSDDTCRVEWETRLPGVVSRALVANKRLIVTSEDGVIACFGARAERPVDAGLMRDAPAVALQQVAVAEDVRRELAALLEHVSSRAGYAVIDQAQDPQLLAALAQQTEFFVIVLQDDAQLRETLRRTLRDWGLLGTRVDVIAGNLRTPGLPLYLADLVVGSSSEGTGPADAQLIGRVVDALRPYSGTGLWRCASQDAAALSAACTAVLPEAEFQAAGNLLVARRPGPLPGAGSWTSQNANAGNTLVSLDTRVTTPLGLLWFGGPSNRDVLPRHGHGPSPQVIGGRLFIEGRNMLRAVDVFTGRLLWQREFPDVGIFYDNTDHHPGAGAIGGNYVCTADSVYLLWGRRCLRLDPATGDTLAEFTLPPDESGDQPYWGYLAVAGDYLVAGSSPMLLLARGPGEKIQLQRAMPLYSAFGEGSRRLVVMDRFDGRVHWTRDALFNFRHNAIAVGAGKVFCLDRMTEERLAHFRRRGTVPAAEFALHALDIHTGEPVWQSTELAFGTWLAYSESTGLLLQAGSKNRDRATDEVGKGLAVFEGATGRLIWHLDEDYGGPPLLYPDKIVTQGTAYDLWTGAAIQRTHPLTGQPLRWGFSRNYGCNTAIGCLNLITFRSAAAGYFDLANDGGTGNWGGFRSGCTANLIVADGLVNAPDYTRTCTCSYQNQCSLALLPMPEVETWTFNAIPSSGQRVERMGINFAAPGDRRADDGTLWLDYPSVGGPSPDVPLVLVGERLEYERVHSSLRPRGQLPWVFASGVRGAQHMRLRLASREEAGNTLATYGVRLYWRDLTPADLSGSRINIRLQGQSPGDKCSVRADPDATGGGVIQEWSGVQVGEFLDLDIASPPGVDPMLCGVQVVRQDQDTEKMAP
ncbi:MAG: PQQ-binding-like beta-propeller repeat protein [Planctomycetaceae bacterium]|nr:PQQ-binding-like beta-propeller repeat protein [Planctomycetaceae bacterium]